jgi:hypothetical protein
MFERIYIISHPKDPINFVFLKAEPMSHHDTYPIASSHFSLMERRLSPSPRVLSALKCLKDKRECSLYISTIFLNTDSTSLRTIPAYLRSDHLDITQKQRAQTDCDLDSQNDKIENLEEVWKKEEVRSQMLPMPYQTLRTKISKPRIHKIFTNLSLYEAFAEPNGGLQRPRGALRSFRQDRSIRPRTEGACLCHCSAQFD